MDYQALSKKEFFDELYADRVEDWNCEELGDEVRSSSKANKSPVFQHEDNRQGRSNRLRVDRRSPTVRDSRASTIHRHHRATGTLSSPVSCRIKGVSPVKGSDSSAKPRDIEDRSASQSRRTRRVSPISPCDCHDTLAFAELVEECPARSPQKRKRAWLSRDSAPTLAQVQQDDSSNQVSKRRRLEDSITSFSSRVSPISGDDAPLRPRAVRPLSARMLAKQRQPPLVDDAEPSSSSRVSPIDSDDDLMVLKVVTKSSTHQASKKRRCLQDEESTSPVTAKRARTQTKPTLASEDLAWPRVEPTSTCDEAYISRLQERVSLIPTKKGKKSAKAKAAKAKVTDQQIRNADLEYLEESERFFKGKKFRFYPQEGTWPLWTPRINKAVSRGAEIVANWWESTHIIIRHDIHISDLHKKLGVSDFPSHIAVVKDEYEDDCLQTKTLLNPRLPVYRVDGDKPLSPPAEKMAPAGNPATERSVEKSHSDPQSAQPHSKQDGPLSDSSRLRQQGTRPTVAPEPVNRTSSFVIPKARGVKMNGRRGYVDDLERAIEDSKAVAVDFLPADDFQDGHDNDEGENQDDQISSDSSSSESEKRRKLIKVSEKGSSKRSWQDTFACMEKHDGSNKDSDPNALTIAKLQELANHYEVVRDSWRAMAYRKAIGALRNQKHRITFKEDAESINGIGESIATMIQEIALTNRLRLLENTSSTPSYQALHTFLKVYGAGHTQALKWIGQGFRTIEDLKSKAELTRNQAIGVEHYEDFLTRIPRSEVEEHGRLVTSALKETYASMQTTIGGSYRRRAADSGDVDFMITAPNMSINTLRTLVLKEFIPRMFERGYLKCSLAVASADRGTKWHGAAALPGSDPCIWRRVDFFLVPWDEWGAALIYFTGNDIFNRSIRLLASRKGMRLNQNGLWKDAVRGPGWERLNQGTLLEARREERIFQLLGVPWRPPEHRKC